jgi:putative ATP-dependent endonuclease of the OLD family
VTRQYRGAAFDLNGTLTVHKETSVKLESLRVANFRSIDNIALVECGSFNVLIGKNNSGKSTILSALYAFFGAIKGGALVSIDPPVGSRLDFHKSRKQAPIELAATFRLDSNERSALIADIAAEATQMKNAMEALPQSLHLSMSFSVISRPSAPCFAYVKDIYLTDAAADATTSTSAERKHVLLSLNDITATELADRKNAQRQVAQVTQAIETVVKRIDSDDWERFRTEALGERRPRPEAGSRIPLSYFIRHMVQSGMTDQAASIITNLIQSEKTYQEFQTAVDSYIRSQNDEQAAQVREPFKTPFNTFAGQDTKIPIYIANLVSSIAKLRIQYLTDRRADIGKAEAERLLNLKTRRGGLADLQNIQDTVVALLGVRIDAFQSDVVGGPAASNNQATAELDVDDFLVQANGSGIREALRLILDVEFAHPDIVLVEEPEMHLHPGLEIAMMRYLRKISSTAQVFLTTHSTNFLDTADMRNVYLVSKAASTNVQLVNVEEAEAQIPRELGLKLSMLFMFDRLAFVEGPTDENILREWASKVGINLSQSNVGFVPIGGSRNFLYFAAEGTLSFLRKRGVRMWFILDRDERDVVEIEKLTQALGERATIIVLKRRELENYLVCPRAMAKFVAQKRQLAAMPELALTAEDVRKTFDTVADELKELAIQKRVARIFNRPAYPKFEPDENVTTDEAVVGRIASEVQSVVSRLEKLEERAADIMREERERVESEWVQKKLEIVPGDELLDRVCRKYGVRYQKDKDGVRLASLIHTEDIPEEIKELLRELARPETQD